MVSSDRPCPRCAAALSADARFCPACGLEIARVAPGQVLDGKYEILDKIGEGGMGEVYRARHLHLDEIRIIKVTKPDASGGVGSARRFQEEARLATLVRHPNVAALYDFSRQADGSFYMVWEFIDGVTLEAWLRRRGRLPPARALEVSAQVLAGLSEIHAQGIVHRDLSPDNIMLREGGDGRLLAKIIDLGIAKRVASESLAMTGTGLFLGKLKYCSPEQAGALAPGEGLDARSDLYSFGVVLYEMLSGRAPFESQTPEGYLGQHLHASPPPLDVAHLPRALGPPLAAIVAKTLEKKRDRRYATARDLADALGRLAPEAARVGAETPEPAPSRRLPWKWAAAAVLAIAGIVTARRFTTTRSGTPEGRARSVPARRTVIRETPAPAPAPAEIVPTQPPAPTPAASMPPAVFPGAAPAPTPEHAEPSAAGPALSPAEATHRIALWKTYPPEMRARRALEIARMANRSAAAAPDEPATGTLRATLPPYLRREATDALDHAEPLRALLLFRAYRALDFAPPDPELERRIENVRASTGAVDARRPTRTDGR